VAVSSPDVSFHFISGAAIREAECGYVDAFWSQRGQCYPHVERDVWGNTFVGSSFLLWEYVVLLSSGTGHGAVSSGPNKTLHCR